MGNRKFYDQIIADMCQHEKDRITDEIDVTTMKDYMQVYWGGRNVISKNEDSNARTSQ